MQTGWATNITGTGILTMEQLKTNVESLHLELSEDVLAEIEAVFRPVSVDNVDEHEMHSEFYTLNQDAADTLNSVKAAGGRIIAVGTTSIRTLETIGNKYDGQLQADSGWTNIFIKPGYLHQRLHGAGI